MSKPSFKRKKTFNFKYKVKAQQTQTQFRSVWGRILGGQWQLQ